MTDAIHEPEVKVLIDAASEFKLPGQGTFSLRLFKTSMKSYKREKLTADGDIDTETEHGDSWHTAYL